MSNFMTSSLYSHCRRGGFYSYFLNSVRNGEILLHSMYLSKIKQCPTQSDVVISFIFDFSHAVGKSEPFTLVVKLENLIGYY